MSSGRTDPPADMPPPQRLRLHPADAAIAIAAALLTAVLSLLLDFRLQPPGLAEPQAAAISLAAGLAHSLSGIGLLSVLAWSAHRSRWAASASWMTVVAVAWSTYVITAPLLGAYHSPIPWMSPWNTLPLLALSSLVGLCVGALVIRLPTSLNRTVASICAGATIGALALLLATFLNYRSPRLPYSLVAAAAGLIAAATAITLRKHLTASRALFGSVTIGALITAAGLLALTSQPGQAVVLGAGGKSTKAVVLITIDTLRADVAERHMPNLALLAQESVVFENAYSPGPWTVPGLLSILTGVHPLVHGGNRMTAKLAKGIPTLAELLSDLGFATTAVGMNPFIRMTGMDRGFAINRTHPPLALGDSAGKVVVGRFVPRYAGSASTTELTNRSLRELSALSNRDFFFWLHYFDPHDPYGPPESYLPKIRPDPLLGAPVALETLRTAADPIPFTPDRLSWVRGLYQGEAAYVDAELGRLLQHLRESTLYDNALIIVTSDHGEEFFEHGSFGHIKTLYEELLRVPLLIKLPRSDVRQRIETAIETTSLAATMLDVLGLPYDADQFSSASLVSLWTEDSASEWAPVVGYGTRTHSAPISVMHNNRKLIWDPLLGYGQYFDLAVDPAERSPKPDDAFEGGADLRDLLQRKIDASTALREFYGVGAHDGSELDSGTIDILKSLGYIQ